MTLLKQQLMENVDGANFIIDMTPAYFGLQVMVDVIGLGVYGYIE